MASNRIRDQQHLSIAKYNALLDGLLPFLAQIVDIVSADFEVLLKSSRNSGATVVVRTTIYTPLILGIAEQSLHKCAIGIKPVNPACCKFSIVLKLIVAIVSEFDTCV